MLKASVNVRMSVRSELKLSKDQICVRKTFENIQDILLDDILQDDALLFDVLLDDVLLLDVLLDG